MNAAPYLYSFLAGALLGALYYGSLWLTVRMMVRTRHARLLSTLSLIARTASVGLGFYLVMAGNPWRAIWCFLGFMVARGIALKAAHPGRTAST
jgi:F1F0 ATPase subunit 2